LILCGVVDRTLAVLVQRETSAVLEQPTDRLQVAPGGGEVEWSRSVAVSQVRVDSLLLDLAMAVIKAVKSFTGFSHFFFHSPTQITRVDFSSFKT
jgi:hypothetical protein